MIIAYVPLLKIMRELHDIPRGQPPDFNGRKRFREYLRTIFHPDESEDQLLPLLAMNPMGKEHVAAALDGLLALDADAVGARVAAETAAELTGVEGTFKFGLVVSDDVAGGWTNRWDYEFTFRFGADNFRGRDMAGKRPHWLKADWIMCVLWASAAPSKRAVCEAVRAAIYRLEYGQRHGTARTLRDMLAQEGAVLARAGCDGPSLDADDIAYTREVLKPFLDAVDKRTCMECLFGDAAGRTLGFTPRGLSPWAGIALALHDVPAPDKRPQD